MSEIVMSNLREVLVRLTAEAVDLEKEFTNLKEQCLAEARKGINHLVVYNCGKGRIHEIVNINEVVARFHAEGIHANARPADSREGDITLVIQWAEDDD